MSRRMRSAALLATLAVLLGVIVIMVVRGDPVPAELFMPLGAITAFLIWLEKERPGRGGSDTEEPAKDSESET